MGEPAQTSCDAGCLPQASPISWALPWLLMGCISCHPTVAFSTIGHQELSPSELLRSARPRLFHLGMLLRSRRQRKPRTTAQRSHTCSESKIPLACKQDAATFLQLV